jgi:hypothetical protein
MKAAKPAKGRGIEKNERNLVRWGCEQPTQRGSRYENHNRNHRRSARASGHTVQFAGCF